MRRFVTALALLVCFAAACGGGSGSASTKRWTALHKSIVTRSEVGAARIGPFAYAVGGFFYVLAGRARGKGNFKVAERYDPRKNRWQQLPDMKHARGGIACGVVQGKIVVFGGEEAGGTIADVERYDPATRKWTRLPDMKTSRHGLGGVARGRRVYAIEGGRQPGFHFSNVIEALDVR